MLAHSDGISSYQVTTVRPLGSWLVCCVQSASAPAADGSLRCTAWVSCPPRASTLALPPGWGAIKSVPAGGAFQVEITISPSPTRQGGVAHPLTAVGLTCHTPMKPVSIDAMNPVAALSAVLA